MIEPIVLTMREAADALRVSRGTVYRLASEGMPTVLIRGRLRVPRAELEAWVSRQATRHEPAP